MTADGWFRGRVEQLGVVQGGKQRNMKAPGELRPYLRVANVFDGRIDISDVLSMPFTEEAFDRYRLAEGDILLNEGQSLELVGRCSMYRGEFGSPCAFQNALIRFRAGPQTTTEFAEHLFRWCQRSGVFASIATQTTSIAHLGVKRFAQLEVSIPPLPEQRKIAAILSAADELIEQTEAVIEQLQVVKKAMMQELLTRGLPGRHTRFKKTEIGEIPESWRISSLGDMLDGIDAGWSPKCESRPATPGEWGVLKVSSVTWGSFRYVENKRLPDSLEPRPNIVVRVGDVLVSRANTPDLVGRAVVVRETPPCLMLSDKLLRLRPKESISPEFINSFLAMPYARERIQAGATGSSRSMKNISQAKLKAIPIPVPSLQEQQCIVEKIRAIEIRLEEERNVAIHLQTSKAALMSVLLTGEVRVTPDEASP